MVFGRLPGHKVPCIPFGEIIKWILYITWTVTDLYLELVINAGNHG